MRCFVGLALPDHLREYLLGLSDALGCVFRNELGTKEPDYIRPVWKPEKPDNYHVTVKFIGDTERLDVPNPMLRLREGLKWASSKSVEFHLSIAGIQCFEYETTGGWPAAYVVARVGGNIPALEKLKADIDDVATRNGVPEDSHAFNPHITLGRLEAVTVTGLSKLQNIPENLSKTPQEWKVTHAILYQSRRDEVNGGGIFTPNRHFFFMDASGRY